MVDMQQSIGLLKDSIQKLDQEIAELSAQHLQVLTQHNGLRIKLDSEMKLLRQFDVDLVALEGKKKDLVASIDGYSLQKKQLDDQLSACHCSIHKLQERLTALATTNPWIPEYQSYLINIGRHVSNECMHYLMVGSLAGLGARLILPSII